MAARSPWVPFVAAVGAPLAAYALQTLLWSRIRPSPHLLFYPAVFVAGVTSMTIGRLHSALRRQRAAREATDVRWSIIAHDLRTPLTTIVFGSSMLARRLRKSGGELERSARAIERSSKRAQAMLQETADAMSLEDGKLELSVGPCDVRELFTTVVEDVAGLALPAGLRIDIDVATRRSIECDEPRIVQVLENLLTNAIRFTPRGGTISLIAEDDGDDVRITVRDTGRGIDPEALPKIFERRWTKESGGTGLGLWIARGIVEAHGRELVAQSRAAAGAAFSFTMPAATH